MRTSVSVLAPFALAALLTSCAAGTYSIPTKMNTRYPLLDVSGAAASELTLDDVQQLTHLAQNRSDIFKPLTKLEMQRPREAYITSGTSAWNGKPPMFTTFTARKKNARWYVVPGSVKTL